VSEDVLRERVANLSLEQKVRLLMGADFWALYAEPAAGLRRLVMSDGPAGVRGERWDEREPSANVPSPTLLAATWDDERIERLGRLLAAEARRKGVDVVLAPMVNLHRTPYGGRHFESFSEDPLLTARIGSAYVRGLQAEGVAATVKHFVANDSETERFTLDARVAERPLRELYLAPFEAIVHETGAWTVMAAYNAVNGNTMTESPMLREILREEWGWDGLVMSDWTAARSTEGAGNAALDLAMPGPFGPWGDALVEAVRDGRVPEAEIDEKVLRLLRLAARVGALEGVEPAAPAARPWSDEQVAAELRATAAAGFVLARNEGVLPLAPTRVAVVGPSAAVARTLGGGSATVFPPYTVSPLEGLQASGFEVTHAAGVKAHTRIPAATEAMLPGGVHVRFLGAGDDEVGSEHRHGAAFTWLGTLPPGTTAIELRATLKVEPGEHMIGVTGVGRHRMTLDGERLFDEQVQLTPGADPGEAVLRPPQHGVPVTLDAERELVLRYEPPSDAFMAAVHLNVDPPFGDEEAELECAVALAAQADVALVVVGTNEEVECEGVDRADLALPGRQDELVARVAQANPRTVVVVNAGAPVLLPWADDVAAIVLAWFPGQEFGNALADVLTGATEPGGRLPTTWPKTEEALPSTQPRDGVLEYEEGLFVGYRAYDRDRREPRFAFGHGLGYTDWDYLAAEPTAAGLGIRLRNGGDRRGREIVQVYASKPGSAVERPPRWLAGYAVAEADPGEEVTVEVPVARRAFEHWDGGWTVESGTFRLEAGRSSRDLRVAAEVTAEGVSP
jgi:beta-glucosidase